MRESSVVTSGPVSNIAGVRGLLGVCSRCMCVSGAELQVNATGYNHRSGSLTLCCVFVCVQHTEKKSVLGGSRWWCGIQRLKERVERAGLVNTQCWGALDLTADHFSMWAVLRSIFWMFLSHLSESECNGRKLPCQLSGCVVLRAYPVGSLCLLISFTTVHSALLWV